MAALLLLLAILGASVVADLVVEDTGSGAITVLGHPITGSRDGLLLAMAAALALVIGSLSLRRTRRACRLAGVAAAAGLEPPAAAGTAPPPLADHEPEPIDAEARRVAPPPHLLRAVVAVHPPIIGYRSGRA